MRQDRAAGFTLLEVVIALVIAGLALVGLFRAGSGGLFAVETAGRVEQAIQRAQSHLAAVGSTGAIAVGEAEGDDGGGFHWRMQIEPARLPQGEAAGRDAPSTLFDVEIVISWPERGRTRTVALTTRRLGIAAGGE